MKVNLPFVYLTYIMILFWIFISKEIFFKLIVVLFIISITLEYTKPIKNKSSLKKEEVRK